MRFTLTISFVLLITCAIAAPVAMAPNPGDLTLVKSTDLLNQGPNTKPNAVFDANGDKRDGRGRPHPGVVTDGPGPKNDYGIALVSHKLPTDAFPHQADAHKLNPTLFQPDTTINVGKPVRAKQANMNPKNVPLGSLSGSELQRLHDKIGIYTAAPVTKAPLPKGSEDDLHVKSKAIPAPEPKNKAPLAPLPAHLPPATGGKKGSKTV